MASKSESMPIDSTLNCILGLRTILARFCFWINLPFCWIVLILTLTGHVEAWRQTLDPDQQYWVNVSAGLFGCWLLISHTIGVFGAIQYELWWNPYVYYPRLRGMVDAEEEQRMLEMNRRKAKELWNNSFGDRQRCNHCGR